MSYLCFHFSRLIIASYFIYTYLFCYSSFILSISSDLSALAFEGWVGALEFPSYFSSHKEENTNNQTAPKPNYKIIPPITNFVFQFFSKHFLLVFCSGSNKIRLVDSFALKACSSSNSTSCSFDISSLEILFTSLSEPPLPNYPFLWIEKFKVDEELRVFDFPFFQPIISW